MKVQRILTGLVIAVIMAFWPGAGWSHPLGNFTLNHYAGLDLTPDPQGGVAVTVDYVLDMAEIPAFQAITQITHHSGGKPTAAEAESYHPAQCQSLLAQTALTLNQEPIPLTQTGSGVTFPPGVGGLLTLRLSCQWQGRMDSVSPGSALVWIDHNHEQRLGWREITLNTHGIPVSSTEKGISGDSISQRLSQYPPQLLNSPPNQKTLHLIWQPPGALESLPAAASAPSQQTLAGREDNPLTRLITLDHLDPVAWGIALGIAFVWGGIHALSPGHGKTIAGAYLVGSRGTAYHALVLGLTTAITHTAGIFVLGGLTWGASPWLLTEQLYPWLGTVSGFMVVVIGIQLLRQRLRGSGEHRHDHGHHHDHDHSHNHDHAPLGQLQGHLHEHPHPHSHHSHGIHSHSHDGHSHHDHSHHGHSHHDHSHDPEAINWASLLTVGISGGIIPCPAALVVMLSAIAMGRFALGLLLVTAFSCGLAVVLSAVGLLMVYGRRWVEQFKLETPLKPPLIRFVPALSALMITLFGLGITAQSLLQFQSP